MESKQLHELATRGAAIRLAEIDAERGSIVALFPELDSPPPAPTPAVAPTRKRRRLSARRRAEISLRMKKYWAGRRADAKKAR